MYTIDEDTFCYSYGFNSCGSKVVINNTCPKTRTEIQISSHADSTHPTTNANILQSNMI